MSSDETIHQDTSDISSRLVALEMTVDALSKSRSDKAPFLELARHMEESSDSLNSKLNTCYFTVFLVFAIIMGTIIFILWQFNRLSKAGFFGEHAQSISLFEQFGVREPSVAASSSRRSSVSSVRSNYSCATSEQSNPVPEPQVDKSASPVSRASSRRSSTSSAASYAITVPKNTKKLIDALANV